MAKVMVINAVWVAMMGGMLAFGIGLYTQSDSAPAAYGYSQVASIAQN